MDKKEFSNVQFRKGGPYSLFCYTCKRWISNTANHEMEKEGYFSHGHLCVKKNGVVEILLEKGIPEEG